jgi:Mlc titration factor MtfA (ptsG expression regulator)
MIAKLNYFRLYAYTNQYEFIAVILEYFFETPREFKQKLPELYGMVKKMINFKESRPGLE